MIFHAANIQIDDSIPRVTSSLYLSILIISTGFNKHDETKRAQLNTHISNHKREWNFLRKYCCDTNNLNELFNDAVNQKKTRCRAFTREYLTAQVDTLIPYYGFRRVYNTNW